MSRYNKFNSDIKHILTKYIDETSTIIKEFETTPKDDQPESYVKSLYEIRLEQYYALLELQRLFTLNFY